MLVTKTTITFYKIIFTVLNAWTLFMYLANKHPDHWGKALQNKKLSGIISLSFTPSVFSMFQIKSHVMI